ncbi:MAG: hypothetical protein AAF596_00950 [Planctomycetota bacterium]
MPKPITPPEAEELQAAIDRGVDFLLADQRPDGRWGSAEKTKGLNIYSPVPGAHHAFRSAVTGLAVSALIEAEPTLDSQRAARVAEAIDRGRDWMFEHSAGVRRANADALYNTWGHAFALHGFVRLYHRAAGDDDLRARIVEAAQQQADLLSRYSYLNGGWGYYDFTAHTQVPGGSPNSFTTATGLIALHEARELGVTYPESKVEKGVESLLRQRFPDFSYAYGEYLMRMPRMGINRPAGSLGRSQACNLALRYLEEEVTGETLVTDDVLKTWLNRLYARNGWLSIGRKYPVPHEAPFGVAGYFYYYGHFYAALTLELLPDAERVYFQDHLAHLLLPLQEKDGSWWDYPFYNYHQQYGTAMAILSLRRCQHGPLVEDAVEQVAEAESAVR